MTVGQLFTCGQISLRTSEVPHIKTTFILIYMTFSCTIPQTNNQDDHYSLPDVVVTAPSLNIFKNRLDKHWINQDVVYDWHVEISGTGSRRNIFC